MNEAVTLALIAIVGSVITALFKLLNNNTKALQSLDEGSRERNGHLAKLVTQGTKNVIGHIDKQHVTNQTVDRQTVRDRRKK